MLEDKGPVAALYCHRPLAHVSLYNSCLSRGTRSGRKKYEYCLQQPTTQDSYHALAWLISIHYLVPRGPRTR